MLGLFCRVVSLLYLVVLHPPCVPSCPFSFWYNKVGAGQFGLVCWVSPSSACSSSWSPPNEQSCLGMPFTQGRQLPLRYCIDFLWNLHVQPSLRVLLSLSMLSLEKLLFGRRAVSTSVHLPGRDRMKWLVVLLDYEEEMHSGAGLLLSSPYITPTL